MNSRPDLLYKHCLLLLENPLFAGGSLTLFSNLVGQKKICYTIVLQVRNLYALQLLGYVQVLCILSLWFVAVSFGTLALVTTTLCSCPELSLCQLCNFPGITMWKVCCSCLYKIYKTTEMSITAARTVHLHSLVQCRCCICSFFGITHPLTTTPITFSCCILCLWWSWC